MPIPLVSVIVPTFNRPAQTLQAVESVRRQSYRNHEIIVIDDGSEPACQRYLARVLPAMGCRVEFLDRNRGACAARNRGLALAQGDYICFLDSDDAWSRVKIERQVAALASAPPSTVGVTCGSLNVTERGCSKGTWIPPEYIANRDLLRANVVGSCSNVLLSRDVLERAGGFDEELKACQDWDLWLRCTAWGPIIGIPDCLVIYYDGAGARISNDQGKRLQGHLRFYRKHSRAYCGADDDLLVDRDLKLAKLLLTNHKLGAARDRFRQAATRSTRTGYSRGLATAVAGLVLARIPTRSRARLVAAIREFSRSLSEERFRIAQWLRQH